MKFKICKVKRKTKSVLVVQAMDEQGKKKNLQIFELNQKRQANAYVEGLKSDDPDMVMPKEVPFKLAFKEYKKEMISFVKRLKKDKVPYNINEEFYQRSKKEIMEHVSELITYEDMWKFDSVQAEDEFKGGIDEWYY